MLEDMFQRIVNKYFAEHSTLKDWTIKEGTYPGDLWRDKEMEFRDSYQEAGFCKEQIEDLLKIDKPSYLERVSKAYAYCDREQKTIWITKRYATKAGKIRLQATIVHELCHAISQPEDTFIPINDPNPSSSNSIGKPISRRVRLKNSHSKQFCSCMAKAIERVLQLGNPELANAIRENRNKYCV